MSEPINKEKIILIGGGGHAHVLIDMIGLTGEYKIHGIVDPGFKPDEQILGITVLGGDDLLEDIYKDGVHSACIALGSTGNNRKRKTLFESVKKIGFQIVSLVHPKASVAHMCRLYGGVQIMAGAIIQAGTTINENTIINTGAVIDHDCEIGRHVHICPRAVLSGGCIVNDYAFIGAGAVIIQCVRIGKGALIGAGAVVIHNVDDGDVVGGVPAKNLSKVKREDDTWKRAVNHNDKY